MYNLQATTIHYLIGYLYGYVSNGWDGVVGDYGRNSFVDRNFVRYEIQRLWRSRVHQIYSNID